MKAVFTVALNFRNPDVKLTEVYDRLKQQLTVFAADSDVGLVCAGPDDGIDAELEVQVRGKWLL